MVAQDVARLLREFSPDGDGEAAKSCELTLALLEWSPNPFSRDFFTPGHVTCTGVVLSPKQRRVLLVHHGRLGRWLLPGGHVEPADSTAADTAAREVWEETGAQLSVEPPRLVGIDVHPIPANSREPLHLHHDLIFAFQAVSKVSACSAESREIAWCGLDEFDAFRLPGSIRRSVARAIQRRARGTRR
jgi:8-oxo-dGTP pyrophosphatase MutT (NUDIX family)